MASWVDITAPENWQPLFYERASAPGEYKLTFSPAVTGSGYAYSWDGTKWITTNPGYETGVSSLAFVGDAGLLSASIIRVTARFSISFTVDWASGLSANIMAVTVVPPIIGGEASACDNLGWGHSVNPLEAPVDCNSTNDNRLPEGTYTAGDEITMWVALECPATDRAPASLLENVTALLYKCDVDGGDEYNRPFNDILKIEVYADIVTPFWTDFVNCEER